MYGPYKSHFACFACRKAFKQPPISDWLAVRDRGYVYRELHRRWSLKSGLERREEELGFRLSDLESEFRDAIRKCPECGERMVDLGLDFKPPRQSESQAWKTLQGVYRVGHVFHTCGCDGPGYIPSTPVDYRRYLEDRRRLYEEHLKSTQESADLNADRKREAREYWAARLAAIGSELGVSIATNKSFSRQGR
ncbi:hypothetical protein [Posidoniimonas polymericola]|nr:hypothetical protein [Posidoniimonas polymericola]